MSTEDRKPGKPEMGLRGPWPGPKGVIPEPTIDRADANSITRRYLDQILIEERLVGAVVPNIEMELFGETFSSPIMMPAFSHLNKVMEDGSTPMVAYAQAAKEMNLVNWVGMEPDEIYGDIAETGAKTIRIIKPFADHDEIFRQMEYAKTHGAIAVGVDIDHVFGNDGKYDVVDGMTMGPVTFEDIKAYVKAAGLPFIIKGVLSASDALACSKAGCAGIVVSHHHGRMPFAIPPLMVLPEILEALDDEAEENGKPGRTMKVFVDCSIDTGIDAFKALAMGADAVSVGRGILPGLLKEGKEGVIAKVTKMNEELSMMMGYTGAADLSEMDATVLWMND